MRGRLKGMSNNIRSKILGAQDIKEELLTIDEWDVEVLVKGLTGKNRARIMQACVNKKGDVDYEKMYPLLVINGAYDPETLTRIFQEADKDAIGDKAGGAVERIALTVMSLSGLSEQAAKDAEKN